MTLGTMTQSYASTYMAWNHSVNALDRRDGVLSLMPQPGPYPTVVRMAPWIAVGSS